MHTKVGALVAFLLLIGCSFAKGQYNRPRSVYELHGGIGALNVFGDMGGTPDDDNWFGLKDIKFSNTRPALYVAARKFFTNTWSAKANFNVGWATGSDKGERNDGRGYSYNTWMTELSVQGEWNFVHFNKGIGTIAARNKGRLGGRMETRMYLYLGVGAIYSSPNLDTHGKSLIPGEYTKSNAIGAVFPVGFGVVSDINYDWAVGFEIGGRYTTTDYLDGLTTNWSDANDIYYVTTLHVIRKFGPTMPRPGSRRRIF